MKPGLFFAGVGFITVCVGGCIAQSSLPGGATVASVTNQEVVAATAFAVKAEEKALRAARDAPATTLELVTILAAEQQVVAGMNYRLKLNVKLNGQEKKADAVVWWQPWRSPAPYELTSWVWR